MDLHSLTREQLYDMVWQKPIVVLAPEFGVSDVAVKKRCKRLGVPTPSRGYWAKIEAGIRPHRTKLPDSIPAAVRRRKNPDSMVYFDVEGADYKLLRPHSFVATTKQATRGAKPDEKGIIHIYGSNIHLGVSVETLPRALWLIDHLLKWLERPGIRMELRDGYQGGLHLQFKDVDILVQIREAIREFPNPAYNPKLEFRILDRTPSKIYRCSGRLKIQVKSDYGYGREWIDKPTVPLDACIKQVADGIVAYLVELADAREQRRERERINAENSRLAWIKQREREAEEKRLRELEKLAGQFDLSKQVAQLAYEVERVIQGRGINPSEVESVDMWLRWARDRSSSLNPVQIVVTSLLSKTTND